METKMNITPKTITIRELIENYTAKDPEENGILTYNNQLIVRPAYQREFVYKAPEMTSLMESISKGFPINIMYWNERNDGKYEILDGQQRTITICEYFWRKSFSFIYKGHEYNFNDFQKRFPEEAEAMLNYELHIYVCHGSESEKLEWFKVVNVAGKTLTNQELRNAAYTGAWLSDAKRYFSKKNGKAVSLIKHRKINSSFLMPIKESEVISQKLLETALSWIADRDDKDTINNESLNGIEGYMSRHQSDADATELWEYFRDVIEWAYTFFKNLPNGYELDGICRNDWGKMYNAYKDVKKTPEEIIEETIRLIDDDELIKKNGVFKYVFDNDVKNLNFRAFEDKDKQKKYREQGGICPICGKPFEFEEMEGDHIVPWSQGGKTTIDNLQMLCRKCNHEKSNRY